MDRKRKIYVIGSVLAVLLFVAFFLLRVSFGNRQHITLPPEEDQSQQQGGNNGSQLNDSVSLVQVTRDTVQNVIATLRRPESYSASLTVTTYWSGGSGSTETQVYVQGSLTRGDTRLPDGSLRHVLSNGAESAIWYDEETKVYRGSAAHFSVDDELHIPSYEDILLLEKEQILEASYEDYGGDACLCVKTEEDAVQRSYYIRVRDGLLVGVVTYAGESKIYEAALSSVNTDRPEDSHFLLPDGSTFS